MAQGPAAHHRGGAGAPAAGRRDLLLRADGPDDEISLRSRHLGLGRRRHGAAQPLRRLLPDPLPRVPLHRHPSAHVEVAHPVGCGDGARGRSAAAVVAVRRLLLRRLRVTPALPPDLTPASPPARITQHCTQPLQVAASPTLRSIAYTPPHLLQSATHQSPAVPRRPGATGRHTSNGEGCRRRARRGVPCTHHRCR